MGRPSQSVEDCQQRHGGKHKETDSKNGRPGEGRNPREKDHRGRQASRKSDVAEKWRWNG
jgi:hypothetical protein